MLYSAQQSCSRPGLVYRISGEDALPVYVYAVHLFPNKASTSGFELNSASLNPIGDVQQSQDNQCVWDSPQLGASASDDLLSSTK
jgi:hypothetical protein